jgi:chemotaxis protein MotA
MLIGCDFNIAKVAKAFVDYPSIMITVGGSLSAVVFATPLRKLLTAMKAAGKVFMPPNIDARASIAKIIELANLARKESLLALEEASEHLEDKFLRKGIMLIVDGTDPELVRAILETDLSSLEGRHGDVRGVWDLIGAQGPAWGMIGTLIGLALMLQELADLASLGANMAIALITTFYGSLLANLIATPISSKLKSLTDAELMLREIQIEGVLSIQAGENSRIIEEKLKAFLAPSLRDVKTDTAAAGGEDA